MAQAIDYASWLDSLDDDDLWTRIAENSRQDGIGHIQNFEAWYDDHDNWDSLESLRPIRIVLVGLGADESARRMADWLAAKGAEIDLLTFLGFRCEGRTLLARQLDSGDEVRKQERPDQTASRRARTRRLAATLSIARLTNMECVTGGGTPSPCSNVTAGSPIGQIWGTAYAHGSGSINML